VIPPTRRSNVRWEVAERVADAVRQRYGGDLQAIAVHGSLAHGDDTDASDVDLVVVTRYRGGGPPAGSRRIDGIVVDLGVIDAEEYLRHARTLTTSWPLAADQYITTRTLHDPDGWFPRLRDAHLSHLAATEGHVFASLAREAWLQASSAQAKARRLVEWFETDAAMVVLGEARLGVAMVEGLLTRTYFRHSADAVTRAGVSSAHILELRDRLTAQAHELARRDRPVDGSIDDLLGHQPIGP
jgi:hypothetical protein